MWDLPEKKKNATNINIGKILLYLLVTLAVIIYIIYLFFTTIAPRIDFRI